MVGRPDSLLLRYDVATGGIMKTKTKRALAAMAPIFLLTACAGFPTLTEERRQVSSAHIGCAPQEISIANTGSATWTAECKAKIFYCTVAPSASCKAKLE